MNNIDKAEKAYKISKEIQEHRTNIEELKSQLKENEKGEKAVIHLYCYWNKATVIEIDKELINTFILHEFCKVKKLTKELDDLLNGDVNKLKECLEGLKYGE